MSNVPSIFGQAAAIVAIGFVVILVLFILIVIWIIRLFSRAMTTRDELLRSGKRIAATVTDIHRTWEQSATQNTSDTVFIITASAPDPATGQPLTFRHKTSIAPGYRIGDPVIVLYDPSNPAKYMFPGR